MWSNSARRQANSWPSEAEAWSRGRRTLFIGMGWAGIIGMITLFSPVLAAGSLVASMVFLRSIGKRIAHFNATRMELLKDRKFKLETLPIHPEDAASTIRWQSPGIPHGVDYREHTRPDGSSDTRAYKILDEDHRDAVNAIKAFVKEKHAFVYKEVLEWWKSEVLMPIVKDHGVTAAWSALDPDQRRHFTALGEVEFFEGLYEAMDSGRWVRKTEIRPSFIRIQRLRDRLKATFPEGINSEGMPWITFPRRKWIYFGKGFQWHPRHAERLTMERSRDLDEIAEEITEEKIAKEMAAKVDGDPRAYGVGATEVEDIYFEEAKFSQHAVVLGGTGYGKSRAIESALMTGIANGDPVFVLDPKGDPRLINLTIEMARKFGRGHDIMFTTLVEPYNMEACTFNPLSDYLEPNELQGRVLAIVPPSDDQPYFAESAASTGRIIGTLCHWIGRYLAAIGDGNPTSTQPPKTLLWVYYVKLMRLEVDSENKDLDSAASIFEDIYHRLRKYGHRFAPKDGVEAALAAMWRCEYYAPASWLPNFGHLALYGIQRPWRLVSWAMRLVHFHVLAEQEAYEDIEWPLRDTYAIVNGKDEKYTGIISLYQSNRIHPLQSDARFSDNFLVKRYSPIYEKMVQRSALLDHVLNQFDETLNEQIIAAEMLKEDFDKQNTSLKAPVSTLSAGGKRRLLCDPDADITWRRVVNERRIVYLALGQMVDRAGSNAVSKTVIQGLTAHLGQVLAKQPDNPPPLWFFGDEMPSWASSEWSDIIDKARSAGIRTFNLSQTIAGMTASVGNRDKVQHMLGSFATTLQFGVQNDEDCQAFAKISGDVSIMAPTRSVGVNPGIGEAGNRFINVYSASENRSFQEKQVPLVDPSQIARMPIGQCFIRRFGKFYLAQIGLLPEPSTNYLREIGIDAKALDGGLPGGPSSGLWLPAAQGPAVESPSEPPVQAIPRKATRVMSDFDEYEKVEAPEDASPVERPLNVGLFAAPGLCDEPPESEMAVLSNPGAEWSAEDMEAALGAGAEEPIEWDPADLPEDLTDHAILDPEITDEDPASFDLVDEDQEEFSTYIDADGNKEVGTLIAGLKNGDFKIYRPNGVLLSQGRYVNDQRDGEWVIFDDQGRRSSAVKYINGVATF